MCKPEVEATAETPAPEVEAAIQRVAARAVEWADLPPAEKKGLFKQCLRLSRKFGHELTQAACASRGLDAADPEQAHFVADATILGNLTVSTWLRGAIQHLESLERRKAPPAGYKTTPRPDGTTRVHFRPTNGKEYVLNDGMSTQLVVRGEARQFNPGDAQGSVTGVLGAGNTEIINDIVDPLLRMNSVVVYKANPVMVHSSRVKAKILAPLIDRGFVAFLFGGAETGRLVVESSVVDRVIMTGSHRTFDRIVWGDRDKRDPSVQPQVTKPVHAELGSVNPYIVVPGVSSWSSAEIQSQAKALAANKLMNSCHVCASPQVLVTCRAWPQREEFLSAVRTALQGAPRARCFYPGAEQAYARHLEAAGGAGAALGGAAMAPIFQEDIMVQDDTGAPPLGLSEEAFCPALYEVAIDSPTDLEAFLPKAVAFGNERCWGSLTCTVVIDDKTRSQHRDAFERALDAMRFGTIAVNVPAASANILPNLTWGAFVGGDARDVQSGIGHLGNLGCYEGVEKSIISSRFSNLSTYTLPDGHRAGTLEKKRADALATAFAKMSHPNLWRVVAVLMLQQPLGVFHAVPQLMRV